MGIEIEHKYLVNGDSYKWESAGKSEIMQGFLSRDPERTVRVRVRDDKGFITVKGRGTGAAHPEFEYEVPLEDAMQLLTLCEPPVIVKTRYIVEHKGNRWEVDEFHGDNEGLVMAEVELSDTKETFEKPEFIADEVTGDPRFYNTYLRMKPFKLWKEALRPEYR